MQRNLTIIGHRGARGLYPENTLPAFEAALKFGVGGLELDVVVSGDEKLVVSHEPWMNGLFCSRPDGAAIQESSKEYNLYRMGYEEIRRFDCGKRGNPSFPEQTAMPAYKPLLSEVIERIEGLNSTQKLPGITWYIEVKTEEDGLFNPPPDEFAKLVYDELKKYGILPRLMLMSFDVRVLQFMRKIDRSVKIALLMENGEGLEANLGRLGFVPDMYGPEFVQVNEVLVRDVHARNMLLIPWTVNEPADMKRLAEMGVDGIITDYPNRASRELLGGSGV